VSRELEAAILLVVGLVVGRLVIDGGYLWYVKPSLFWPLLLATGAIIAVGSVSLWRQWRGAPPEPEHGAEIDHDAHGGHATRVGLLLLAPVAVLVLMAPSPLGAFAADRASSNQLGEPSFDDIFGPLPDPVDGAVVLAISDVVLRASHDESRSLEGVPVRLTGFVVTDDHIVDGYRLTRFVVGCCAADGQPVQVLVTGVGEVPAEDTWVEVVARWDGTMADRAPSRLPVLQLERQRAIDDPPEPYEY
jgi:uncharacterized repeat protein (TIGR03943 family)